MTLTFLQVSLVCYPTARERRERERERMVCVYLYDCAIHGYFTTLYLRPVSNQLATLQREASVP